MIDPRFAVGDMVDVSVPTLTGVWFWRRGRLTRHEPYRGTDGYYVIWEDMIGRSPSDGSLGGWHQAHRFRPIADARATA